MVVDINKIMEETISGVVKKYTHEYERTTLGGVIKEKQITPWREENGEELYLPDELDTQLEKIEIPFTIEVEEAFESCGYECTIVVVAWYNQYDNKVNTISLLMEVC